MTDGDAVEIEPGVRMRLGRARRGDPGPGLAALLAELAGVPAGDVEVSEACPVCGARHGHPTVEYPQTPSGGRWFADAAAAPGRGATVAVASRQHTLGIALVPVEQRVDLEVDLAAFHPLELDGLDEVAFAPELRARARAVLWARKEALLRALGHSEVREPARIALSMPEAGHGTVVRAGTELDAAASATRFHSIPIGETGLVAELAVLPGIR